jgi:hypothetical protein
MHILDSHPSFFDLLEGHKKVLIQVAQPISEYYRMRLLMYDIFSSTPEIYVEGIDCDSLSELFFVTRNNDLRDWNKSEFFFSNKERYFLVRIIDNSDAEDGLSFKYTVSVYHVREVDKWDGGLCFPFPTTKMPSNLMYVNLPIPEIDFEYSNYLTHII